MWRRVRPYCLGVGLLVFCAWGLYTPALDLTNPDETRACARRALAARVNPLELRTLNPNGDGRYTGEAVAPDGRVYRIEVSREGEGVWIGASWRDQRRGEDWCSGLGHVAFFRDPPEWFVTLCG